MWGQQFMFFQNMSQHCDNEVKILQKALMRPKIKVCIETQCKTNFVLSFEFSTHHKTML
jgi:hypothetical protein